MSRVSEVGPGGKLHPNIVYLKEEVGMSLDQIKGIARTFPAFVYCSVERKIKPVVEFLLDLGVPKSDIPVILNKCPQLCGLRLSDNLIPTMTYLEKLGIDKGQWAKVIHRFPALLSCSRSKVEAIIDFLYETGIPSDSVVLFYRSPKIFGLSIEMKLKPITEFFLEKGYSIEEVKTMISQFGPLYTLSLTKNLVPKWEFFQTMENYSMSELVKFPQYFGYSLEERIKPRYKLVKELQISLLLSQLLTLSGQDFEELLRKKLERRSLPHGAEALKCSNHKYNSTEDIEKRSYCTDA